MLLVAWPFFNFHLAVKHHLPSPPKRKYLLVVALVSLTMNFLNNYARSKRLGFSEEMNA